MNHQIDSISIIIEDYRESMNDKVSTDAQIEKRIQYLDTFCRNIIKNEIGKFLAKNRKTLHSVK